ncbi:hypothetical protein C8A00DRAFT_44031 [Chaetomidium leptoderma]|uniref:Uncharacterized protein n=1 Tax=Chaetomidium leptoderma TaxID=669021 RepID=A0AAN6VKQ0_9PEZI|nr:hypothetical protein C8A00DRAFT_44031 [Chaetomidium leptoderma]
MDDFVACDGLGKFLSLRHPVAKDVCCYLGDQNSTACRRIFAPTNGLLDSACITSPERCGLFNRCRSPESLYTSAEQNNEKGNGSLLLARYKACANLPAIATLSSQGLLAPYIDQVAQKHLRLGPDESEFQNSLQQITSSVTDCLSSTCRHARDNSYCYYNVCSPVKLISNGTLPNIQGRNGCLNKICNAGTGALPWADADIVGVGVFSSYVMQCALIPSNEGVGSHFASWIGLVLECHKAQCYFGGTLMIAVIVSNMFDVDLVITFLITPLATNSILPLIFSYFLLVYFRASSAAITLLTAVVYLLSSVVYWILYNHLPLPPGMTRGDMYKRYRLNISSISACGQYSGLAVCSDEFSQGIAARTSLRVLTPLIWTWSTLVFLGLLVHQAYHARTIIRIHRSKGSSDSIHPNAAGRLPLPWQRAAFWFTTLVFLAGVGMQISVLSTAIRLDMVDANGWSFGQVIAVTVWIPPLLEYVCGEIYAAMPSYALPAKERG